jgi:hypothetical protein
MGVTVRFRSRVQLIIKALGSPGALFVYITLTPKSRQQVRSVFHPIKKK